MFVYASIRRNGILYILHMHKVFNTYKIFTQQHEHNLFNFFDSNISCRWKHFHDYYYSNEKLFPKKWMRWKTCRLAFSVYIMFKFMYYIDNQIPDTYVFVVLILVFIWMNRFIFTLETRKSLDLLCACAL